LLPLVLSVLSLATLLVLWLSAPVALDQLMAKPGLPTAGVVVRSADHHTAEAVLNKTVSLSHSEVYLTTQVRPLAVNGVPLVQLLQSTDNLQALVDKFTGIQGYGLAHGQFPTSTGIQFSADEGGTGPDGTGHEGQNVGVRSPGRLLDAHDANSLNVLIPLDSVTKGPGWPSVECCEDYYTYNGEDAPMYPDFLFFRRQGEGVVVDILEPHSLHQDDSAAKAKGLADFALRHGDEFGRIELIVKEKDKLLRLDVNKGNVRDKVRAVSSNQHLRQLFGAPG